MAAGSRTQKQDEKWVFAPAIMLSCTLTKQHMQAYIPISEILKRSIAETNILLLRRRLCILKLLRRKWLVPKNGVRHLLLTFPSV